MRILILKANYLADKVRHVLKTVQNACCDGFGVFGTLTIAKQFVIFYCEGVKRVLKKSYMRYGITRLPFFFSFRFYRILLCT